MCVFQGPRFLYETLLRRSEHGLASRREFKNGNDHQGIGCIGGSMDRCLHGALSGGFKKDYGPATESRDQLVEI